MSAQVIGAQRYQYFEKETGTGASWGVRPTTPVLIHAPTSSYGIKLVRNVKKSNPFAGRAQRHHAQNPNSTVSGSITMPLYGAAVIPLVVSPSAAAISNMEYFTRLATDSLETLDPRPSIRAFDIQRNGAGTLVAGHEHLGLRVNKMTLKGSDSGLELSLDVQGKDEINLAAGASALPDDRDGLIECLFSDVTLSIGGVAIAIDSFEWSIDWGLKAKYLNSNRPSRISAQHNVQEFSFTPLKEAATYDAYLRLQAQTEQEAILVIKGLHSGTGAASTNYTVGTFTFPRASLLSADDAISQDDFGMQPIKMDLLKPDTSADTVTPVWTYAA